MDHISLLVIIQNIIKQIFFAKVFLLIQMLTLKTISTKKEIYLTENELETAKKLGVNYRLHIVRKVQNKLHTYKVIDDFHAFYEINKTDFIVKPTYLLKV